MTDKKGGGIKRIVLWAVIAIALCGAVFAAVRLIEMPGEARQHAEEQAALLDAAVATPDAQVLTPEPLQEIAQNAPTAAPRAEWLNAYAKQPDKTIDFAALRAINEDTVAWITVPGTAIDYPIVFASKGDERYLDYDIKGDASKNGAIFIDGYNRADFSDPVTVVYGHNMKDGSMFATLHSFENGAFFDQNRTIRLYIDDYMLEYEIVAAYKTDDTHILATHDFTDPAVFADYAESIFAVRDMNAKLLKRDISAEDRMIVLATCVHGEDEARYLVQGVLTGYE